MVQHRIFYASAGAANLIASHEFRKAGGNNPAEVSITFSGQVEDAIEALDAQGYLISAHGKADRIVDGRFTIEHRPISAAGGWRYFREQWRYCRELLNTAKQFGATLAVLDSGSVETFLMPMFRRAGIPVIFVLHNTIWPHGFRPTTGLRGLIATLERRFLERYCAGVVAVSPEAARQVYELAPNTHCPVVEMRAQFFPDYFAAIPPAPPHGERPFRVMFIGRVVEAKGVLDIVRMARSIEDSHPGLVHWTICGRGDDLARLQQCVADEALAPVVDVRGWTSLEDLQQVYAQSHAAIVPTRSGFAEGLAMTAAEAALAGRPIITNPVVPAHELLAPACEMGRTNDAESHADAVRRLALDGELYERRRAACSGLVAPFLDRDQGLAAVLQRLVKQVAG